MIHVFCYSMPVLLASGGILHWAHWSFSLAALCLLLLATYILTAGSGKKPWIDALLLWKRRLSATRSALALKSVMSKLPWPHSLTRWTFPTHRTPRADRRGSGYFP